jgi:signal transduction histidine kinase
MLRAFVREAREAFVPGRASPADEAALDAHLVTSVALRARTTALVLNAFHLLFWPTDRLLLARDGAVLAAVAWFRLTTFVNHGALFALLSLRPLVRRAVPVVAVCVAVSAALTGSALARMGALHQPYLHLSYLAPMTLAGIPVRLGPRAFLTALLGAGLLGGYLLTRPGELASPYLGLSLGSMVFAVASSVALGHLLFLLERRAFMNGRALARSEAALQAHNDALVDRVAEQTGDLRRLAAHLSRATEEERRRLQRELHDELAQQLVGIRYTVAFLQQRLRRDPDGAEERLAALGDQVTQLQQGVQHLVTDLRPRVIDDRGLGAAAEWLVATTEARSGVPCELAASIDESVPVGPDLSMDAFRILQESISNALKHAEPSRVRVELSIARAAVELRVIDDGCGVREQGREATGLGLVGMRERARAHGGDFAIGAAPGGGTVVRVRLPITAGTAP